MNFITEAMTGNWLVMVLGLAAIYIPGCLYVWVLLRQHWREK